MGYDVGSNLPTGVDSSGTILHGLQMMTEEEFKEQVGDLLYLIEQTRRDDLYQVDDKVLMCAEAIELILRYLTE